MTLTVNGEQRDVQRGVTLADLIAVLTPENRGVAAAVNDAVVPRSEWTSRALTEHDRIEVLTAVQGG
jgi:sulfur carrier protein